MALLGCSFTEQSGSNSVIDRQLFNNSECSTLSCWGTWTINLTKYNDIILTSHFRQDESWFSDETVVLQGINNYRDITAILDRDTNTLSQLWFTGPYTTTLKQVIETLGYPEFAIYDYRSTVVGDEQIYGLIYIYYTLYGYIFEVLSEARWKGLGEPVELCLTGNEQIFKMRMYGRYTLNSMLSDGYPHLNQQEILDVIANMQSWQGFGCILLPNRNQSFNN
jgi:hypothetical protein